MAFVRTRGLAIYVRIHVDHALSDAVSYILM